MKNAARTAKVFGISPLDILREPDRLAVQALFAGSQIINEDERKQAEQNKARGGGRRGRRR